MNIGDKVSLPVPQILEIQVLLPVPQKLEIKVLLPVSLIEDRFALETVSLSGLRQGFPWK